MQNKVLTLIQDAGLKWCDVLTHCCTGWHCYRFLYNGDKLNQKISYPPVINMKNYNFDNSVQMDRFRGVMSLKAAAPNMERGGIPWEGGVAEPLPTPKCPYCGVPPWPHHGQWTLCYDGSMYLLTLANFTLLQCTVDDTLGEDLSQYCKSGSGKDEGKLKKIPESCIVTLRSNYRFRKC